MNIKIGKYRRIDIEGFEQWSRDSEDQIKIIELDFDFYHYQWEFRFSLTLLGYRIFKIEYYDPRVYEDSPDSPLTAEETKYTDWDCGHKG